MRPGRVPIPRSFSVSSIDIYGTSGVIVTARRIIPEVNLVA
jgi:hypothetical protein